MIKNQDGTPYRAAGSMQQFNPESTTHDLLNIWDEEVIRMGGIPIIYYEVFINTANIDKLYVESRSKIFSDQGIQLYGYYEPIGSQAHQNMFGIDSLDEITFEFNYRSVLKTLGHPPKVGSRMFTPHKQENWQIVDRKTGEFGFWGELRLLLTCQRYQESSTTGDGRVTGPQTDFKIN